MSTLDTLLVLWFALTAVAVAYVARDVFTQTPLMKLLGREDSNL